MADFSVYDPYSQVIYRLWYLLEQNTTFTGIVKAHNRIKFNHRSGKNPIKENIQNGDVPEVMIEPTTSMDGQAWTSTQAKNEQSFLIKIVTLDMRTYIGDGTGMNELRWLVYQILSTAGDTLGLDFVYKARITSSMQHYIDPINRGTIGWVCLFTITCALQLPKAYPVTPPPVITSATSVTAQQSEPFVYQITATHSPTSFSATGLPSGLTLNTATGLITGAPLASGQQTFTVGATNLTGTGTQGVVITMAAGITIQAYSALAVPATVPPVEQPPSIVTVPVTFGIIYTDGTGVNWWLPAGATEWEIMEMGQ